MLVWCGNLSTEGAVTVEGGAAVWHLPKERFLVYTVISLNKLYIIFFCFNLFIYRCYHRLDGRTSPVLIKYLDIPPGRPNWRKKVQIYPIWSRLR